MDVAAHRSAFENELNIIMIILLLILLLLLLIIIILLLILLLLIIMIMIIMIMIIIIMIKRVERCGPGLVERPRPGSVRSPYIHTCVCISIYLSIYIYI